MSLLNKIFLIRQADFPNPLKKPAISGSFYVFLPLLQLYQRNRIFLNRSVYYIAQR